MDKMFDFSNLPFFDNHSHLLDENKKDFVPSDIPAGLYHGIGDILPESAIKNAAIPTNELSPWCSTYFVWKMLNNNMKAMFESGNIGISKELENHALNLGVAKTMIHLMSEKFNCAPTFEAVAAERNKRTKNGMLPYAKELYEDANIVGTVCDSELPAHDPNVHFPAGPTYRLLLVDPLYVDMMGHCSSFVELKEKYKAALRDAIKNGGFTCFKSHPVEICTKPMVKVSDAEAEASFAAAQHHEPEAFETIYSAMFGVTLEMCQELDCTLHIHLGTTGEGISLMPRLDPFYLGDILACPEYLGAKVVFLHGAYPYMQHLAIMAHTYPNLYVDLGWVLPWNSIDFTQTLREMLGVAPHSKILLGSGGHYIPETAWVAAKVAKRALEVVMEQAVVEGTLSKEQAQETAEQLLYKNGYKLYNVA